MNNNRCARTTRKVHQTLKGLILDITEGSTRQSTKTYFLFSYSLAASFFVPKVHVFDSHCGVLEFCSSYLNKNVNYTILVTLIKITSR